MLVYRCVSYDELESIKEKKKLVDVPRRKGANNFYYSSGKNYKHFFLFAEAARLYKGETYGMVAVLQCDIPCEVLTEHSGIGYYSGVITKKLVPLPEFSIPEELFMFDYIKHISDEVKPEWNRETDFREYVASVPEHLIAPLNSGRFIMEDYSNAATDFKWQKYMKRS